MIRVRGRWSPSLAGALLAYAILAFAAARGVGVVGEVVIGWALPDPPRVLVQIDPPVSADTGDGPLRASRARPTERLVLGPVQVPLAVNAYTGGAADWPARAARALTGELGAGYAVHVALGALLLALAHRFLSFHGTAIAAAVTAWVLATDWAFVFYRKVLGGTEILLQAAGLLVIWALWSRRWKGGVHGTVAIAAGVGLGLHAKATFAATLAAFAIATFLTRWDHPALKPPRRVNPLVLLGLPLLCVAPLLVAAVHGALLPTPEIPSHDTLGLQARRLLHGLSSPSPAREGAANLLTFFGNPLAFFHAAYGAAPESPVAPLRFVGLGVIVAGAALGWRHRSADPSSALLRFLSLAVPLQIGLLFLANRDLHHLAQATVPLALLAGLAVDRLASTTGPPRSFVRGLAAAVLATPLLASGAWHLARTDAVVATIPVGTFTERGQAELVELLRAEGVTELVAADYELYGMLEARAPEIAVTHVWGAVARGEKGPAVLRAAVGRHFLAVRASAPMIYNWSPDARKVARAAEEAGVRAVPVGTLGDPEKPWATLYRVEAGL